MAKHRDDRVRQAHIGAILRKAATIMHKQAEGDSHVLIDMMYGAGALAESMGYDALAEAWYGYAANIMQHEMLEHTLTETRH